MFFGSDNQTGASLQVLEMIKVANTGYTHGYGDDEWTGQAIDALKKVFECDLHAYFVSTGTASNSLALSCLVQPWEAILCHHLAHILIDESTAPENFTGGARLIPISKGSGKLTTEHLEEYFLKAGTDFPHNSRAGTLSITQANEAGLVYTEVEIKALSTLAKDKGLRVHMDGARFANALVTLGSTPAELSWKSGVDVLCLGATKCGALCAEAVIFFNMKLAETFIHRRKRSGHLLSKGRVFGAQIVGWLQDNHWLELAKNANTQATQLAEVISSIDGLQLVWPVQSNELFVTMPKDLADNLQEAGAEFYEWNPEALPPNIELHDYEVFVRLVTSFATQNKQREEFCELIREYFSVR
jgi:threonine aldolase